MTPASGDSPWAGAGALTLLSWMRLRGQLRHLLRSLRQPKRALLALFGVVLVGFWAWGASLSDADQRFAGMDPALGAGLFLSVFVVSVSLGALANGALAFSPAEVQFLLPGPIGSRALVAAHLASAQLKALSGGLVFCVVLRPGGVSFARSLAAYALFFATLGSLALAVDLAQRHVPPPTRRRRALLGALLVVGGAAAVLLVGAARLGAWQPSLLEPLTLLSRPWTRLLLAEEPLPWLLLGLGLLALPTLACLSVRGPVRDRGAETSARVQKQLERIAKGQLLLGDNARQTSGRLLPLPPRWGGAGIHIWRQLSVLRRKRRPLGLAAGAALLVGTVIVCVDPQTRLEPGAAAAFVLLLVTGPLLVQADFRSDYDNLAWLRSLPTSDTALAAGQVLASALVLWVLQLLLTVWVLPFVEPGHLRWWLVGYALALPVQTVQLCVDNGVHLLFPVRLMVRSGPPGALAILRLYAVFFARMLVLFVALGLPVLAGGVIEHLSGSRLAAWATASALLLAITWLCLVVVGRLFRGVDPSRDLGN